MRTPETRPSLIHKLAGPRHEPAWGEFVATYEPFLTQLARRRGVPERMVPDVTQQILLAIARSVGQWQDDGHPESFRRWMGRVARNAVIKFMVRERSVPDSPGGTGFLQQLADVPTPDDPAAGRAYEFEVIHWAAEQVRKEFQETSWRAFYETMIQQRPVDEVSRELHVSPGSIYMSRSRIIARIREKVQQIGE